MSAFTYQLSSEIEGRVVDEYGSLNQLVADVGGRLRREGAGSLKGLVVDRVHPDGRRMTIAATEEHWSALVRAFEHVSAFDVFNDGLCLETLDSLTEALIYVRRRVGTDVDLWQHFAVRERAGTSELMRVGADLLRALVEQLER